MGEDGFLWMLRGHRHGGTGKQGKTEAHMVAQDMLFTPWPGKFPQKYEQTDILNRGVRMGADG